MRSTGHRNPLDESPGTERETSLPGTARAPAKAVSETVLPTGTAPGCHVTVARPSSVRRLPAMPRRTVWVPIETGGSGAATTTSGVAGGADAAPPRPGAVTTSERGGAMASGGGGRRGAGAGGDARDEGAAALARG